MSSKETYNASKEILIATVIGLIMFSLMKALGADFSNSLFAGVIADMAYIAHCHLRRRNE